MKLEFRRLATSNFRCFREKLDLDLRKFSDGLHFVKGINEVEPSLGSNGAGKSSLFNSLCWCLYGKTVNGQRNPDIRPWSFEGRTRVRLVVRKDGKLLRVVRTTPHNSLTINGETVGQDQIDHDIMPYQIFTNTILLGQGRPLFFDLSSQGKMDLFVEVLELDRWDERSKIASEEVKRLSQREFRLMGELGAARAGAREFASLCRQMKDKVKHWETVKNYQASQIRARVEKLKSEVEELTLRKNEVAADIEGLTPKLELDKDRLEEHVRDLRKLEREYEKAVVLRRRAGVEVLDLEQQLLSLREAKICPTCGQPVKRRDLVKHRDELAGRISKLRIEADESLILDLSNQVDVAKDLVEGTKKVVEEYESEMERYVSDLRHFSVGCSAVESRLSEVEKQLEFWDSGKNPHSDQLSSLRSKLKIHRSNVVELREELDRIRRRIGRVQFWVKGFKNCRLYMLEEILEELRLVSNAVCPELGLDGWDIDYRVEKENKSGSVRRGLNVSITSPDSGKVVRWESFSGGEQQRLRLIGSLSLSEVLLNHAGVETDLEILDEPTRSMSSEGIRDLCETLPSRALRLGRRTFYVDHQAVESSHFSSVLLLRRRSSGVELEMGE